MEDYGWEVPGRGDRARDELVRCGLDMLVEQGWARLTVRGVAGRAGVSPSLVVYHFGGIASLRRAVATEAVEEMLQPLLRVVVSQHGWREGIAAALRHVQDEAERDLDTATGFDDLVGYGPPGPAQRHVLADVVMASMQDAVVREVVQESLTVARERVVGWLEDVGAPVEHVEGAAVLLVAVLDGVLLHHAVDPALPLGRAADALTLWSCQPLSAGTTSRSKSSMPLVS